MSFSLNATTGVITQSGTDTDLSGLSSITGITVYDDDPTKGKVTYDMGDLRLRIDGTLSHDPDRELMIFHHDKGTADTSVSEPVLQISGGGTYNYGVKTTTSDGKVGYSSGCGLMITGRGYSNWHPSDNAINFGAANANFVCRGGVVESSRGLYFGGNADIEETVFVNASSRFSLEIRVFGNGTISTDRAQNVVLAGGISVMDAYRMTEQKIIFREGAISRVFGSYYEAELFDFDVSKNVFSYDIGNCANTGQSIQDHHIVNSATGSDVRTMWRNTTGNASQMGNTFIHKEVSFNIKDTSANGIEGVKLYLQDNPSNFAKSISVTTTNTSSAHIYPNPTLSNATVSNAGKTISYDYTGAIEYEKTTDVNGDIAKFRVLTATQFLEYGADDSSATQYFTTFTSGKWRESDGQAPVYSDWDTNRFGNFYKVDRRSDSNSNADDFTFKFGSYGHQLSSTTQALKGLGELEVDWVLFNDDTISEPNKTTVDNYIAITDSERFYDRAKSYLIDNYAGELSTLVTRSGLTIDAGDNNIVLDPNVGTAADAFDLTAATFSTFSGVFITAAAGNPASQPVTITANTAGNITIELVGNDTDTVATLAAAQGATATGNGASEVLASGDSNKITITGGSNPIITIKCTSFTGNLTTTETITVNSGVTVLGTITDVNNPAGLSSRTFSVSNVILGTTIQIYNETQSTKRGTTEGYTPTNVYETLIASGTTTDSTLIGDGSSTIAQLISAQGLTAALLADTSYVLPSGWKLETTEVVNEDNRVTISGIYDEGASPNGDFNVGDSVRIRATCAAATGAFLPFVNTTIANESGFSIRVNQQADTIYNDNGIDGSAVNYDTATLTLTPDYTNLQIDVLDSDTTGVVTVQQIYAKYAYLITTTEGIENFFGAITAENTSNYRINADVVDLKIQNISANDTILTGARLYRSDNTTVLAKGYLNNDEAQGLAGTISHDTGEFLQYIQPQVEAALNGYGVAGTADTDAIKTDTEAVKKKTNLIPGLL